MPSVRRLLLLLLLLSVCPAAPASSNRISSSRETPDPPEPPAAPASPQNSVRRASHPLCTASDPHEGLQCHGGRRKQPERRPAALSEERAPEMSPCVRSRDCAEGLCCALYLTGRRCQRVPALGELCLLRGRAKFRRRLERCDCARSLYCRALPDSPRGHGACHPDTRAPH